MKIAQILEAKYHQGQNEIELTQAPAGKPELMKKFNKMVNDLWADGVMYRGENVFEWYVTENVQQELAYQLEKHNRDIINLDAQETYLGYEPNNDFFIIGFDAWGEIEDKWDEYDEETGEHYEEEGTSDAEDIVNLFGFQIDDQKNVKDVKPIDLPGRMVYSKGQYRQLKQRFPDLVDVRLD